MLYRPTRGWKKSHVCVREIQNVGTFNFLFCTYNYLLEYLVAFCILYPRLKVHGGKITLLHIRPGLMHVLSDVGSIVEDRSPSFLLIYVNCQENVPGSPTYQQIRENYSQKFENY